MFFTTKARREMKELRLAAIEARISKLESNEKSDISSIYNRLDCLEKQVSELLHAVRIIEYRIGDSRKSSMAAPIEFTFTGNRSRTLSGCHTNESPKPTAFGEATHTKDLRTIE
jgi:hypothetical protein